jgi:glycosyltransferase involved in cell wall biosynthesis
MAKKICMVAYTDYSTDARVRREAETLAADSNFEVKVLTLKQDSTPKTLRLNGVDILELNIGKYRGKSNLHYILSYFHFLVLAFNKLNGLVFKKDLDVVHIHNMPNFLTLSAIMPLLTGKRIVLDIHDTMIETYQAKFQTGKETPLIKILKQEEKFCSALAHKIIAVNQIQKEALVNRGIPESKITISINSPDPRIFNGGPPDKNCESDGFNIVYHGTVSKRLGVDLAIRAMAELSSVMPITFHIIGEGDDREEFQELAKKLGVENRIRFRGKVPLDGLVKILKQMDVGLVPNQRNAATELMLPVKMMECIALGIPVIVPRLQAIEYYFNEEMVTFFEPGDLASLTRAIIGLYEMGENRSTKAMKARKFLDQYGWETHKSTLLNLYQSL